MEANDVQSDLELRALSVQALDNVVNLLDRVGDQEVKPVMKVLTLMRKVFEEAIKNPPPNTSETMLRCLNRMFTWRTESRNQAQAGGPREREKGHEAINRAHSRYENK